MSENTARVWQESLTIPTYPLGAPEHNPMFFAGRTYQGAKGPIYPYPLLDRLSDKPVDKAYKAVYLENEYLKLSVLPEIGGRILSATDKTNGYDFFYRQSVIKPALIGMLGAWISGGVEWNVPHHHRPTTFMPVDYHMLDNSDGSKSLWVGETERRQRMKWLVGLTVYPGRSFVEVTMRIFNRTPYAHSMLFFTNAAVHVNPEYRVIFPPSTEFGTQHAKCEFIKWPVADSTYAGVDYTGGVDVSWWKNHPNWVSIFAWNDWDDFFGGYDHGKDAGVCHYGDHNVSPGKKFFEFGAGPGGQMWDKILTDADGPYLELMAGSYSDNQPDYSWIQPYETRTTSEYWYPIRGLRGISNANRDAAVSLDVNPKGSARLAFNATAALHGATVVLKAGDRVLLEERVDISPDKPYAKEISLPAGTAAESLRASLNFDGREVVAYQPARPKGNAMPKPVVPPPAPKDVKTNEELYLAGLRLEEFHSPALEPYPYYEEALRRDPSDYRANTALGILYLKRGMFDVAEERFTAAVERITANYTRPKDGEALYYLGIAQMWLGKYPEARETLGRAAWSYAWRAAAQYAIAQIDVRAGDLSAAFDAVEHSVTFNVFNTSALGLKTTILRRAGYTEQAFSLATNVAGVDPLDFRARNERLLCLLALNRNADAERELIELNVLMRGDAQSYMELASEYGVVGLWDEAIDVLWRFTTGLGDAPVDPMVHYTLGYYWLQRGGEDKAAEHFDLAAAMPPAYCFPYRLESIAVLEAAIKYNWEDSRAPYYLGNLLYDLQPQRAIREWEKSAAVFGEFATVHRNLGLAYARVEHNNAKAAASLTKALECDPRDAHVLAELDGVLSAMGAPHGERLAIIEAHRETAATRDDTLLRQALLNVFVGLYDRALEILDEQHFHIWEGGESNAHDVYVDAHLLRGQGLSAAGDYRGALAEFLAADEYPERFEMGRPYDGGRAAEVHYLIGTAHEALGDADSAKAAFEKALEKDMSRQALSYYQGLALRKLGMADKAAARFDGLVKLGREMLSAETGFDFFEKFGTREVGSAQKAQAHYLIALGLLGQGMTADARRELEEALRLNVNLLGAQTMLATLQ